MKGKWARKRVERRRAEGSQRVLGRGEGEGRDERGRG